MAGGITQTEGAIAIPGGNVWFQRIGGGPGLPLLVVHGGPGLPHSYLSSLGRLADEREVVFWDQLGCGNSDRPSNSDLWTMERSVAEMEAVVHALGIRRFHVFGNSWGGMLAQQYALDVTSGAVSLTISNSIASIPHFAEMVARLKSDLDPAIQAAIERHEAAGTTRSAEYQNAVRIWNETYLCRARPWPPELLDAFSQMGTEIFETMFGPSDFHIVGTIRELGRARPAGRNRGADAGPCRQVRRMRARTHVGNAPAYCRLTVRVVRVERSHAIHRRAGPVRPGDARLPAATRLIDYGP